MNMSGNRPIDRFSNPVRAIMNLDWCWILWMITAYFASVEASLGNWMYLGVSGVAPMMMNDAPAGNDLSSNSICSSIPGLVPDQVKLCESHPWAIESVSEGARRGIRECQEQFRYERWNCSTRRDHFDIFGYIMKRGSKETAFIYAVTSAGVVHAITEACSSGNLTDCSCDSSRRGHSTPQGWKWGGCSDDIEYGVELAESFVDASEKERLEKKRKKKGYTSPRAVMNLHNNDAGREAVTSLMKMRCRCHGVSGSCELKTCWRALPPFADVGKYLKKKYESAIQVARRKELAEEEEETRLRSLESVLMPAAKRHGHGGRRTRGALPRGDLIHLRKSPDYCRRDVKRGIPGTSGRVCNKTNDASRPDSCQVLCCGRGYNTQVVIHVEKCACKFHWCCYVTCKKCTTKTDVYTCK